MPCTLGKFSLETDIHASSRTSDNLHIDHNIGDVWRLATTYSTQQPRHTLFDLLSLRGLKKKPKKKEGVHLVSPGPNLGQLKRNGMFLIGHFKSKQMCKGGRG